MIVNRTITKNLLLQQAGKKEGGLGERIFARLPSREAGLGAEPRGGSIPLKVGSHCVQ